MHIIKIKGCKRCGGDLFLERDSEGVYISCLQCGAVYIKPEERQGQEARKVPAR